MHMTLFRRNGALARKGIDTLLRSLPQDTLPLVEMEPQPERALIHKYRKNYSQCCFYVEMKPQPERAFK